MSEHAYLSASGAHRWSLCPGAPAAEEPYPDTSSIYADEGTAAHSVMELCLGPEALSIDAAVAAVDGANLEMVEHIERFIAYVHDIRGDDGELHVERRLPYDDVVPEGFGTIDVAIVHLPRKEVHIVDLKYGKGLEVHAKENRQLILYALAVRQELAPFLPVAEMSWVLHIHQPRRNHVSEWRVSDEDLMAWAALLSTAASAALQPGAKRIPGSVQCRWCKHRGACVERANANLETAQNVFRVNTNAPAIADAELPELLSRLSEIRDWCKAIEDEALRRVTAGDTIAGYKLVHARTQRRWMAEADVVKRLKAEGLKLSEVTERKLLGIGKVTKLLKDSGLDVGVVDELTLKPVGNAVLAPEDDPRPTFTRTAEEVFK